MATAFAQAVQAAPRTARGLRSPAHPFIIKQNAFQITPFLCAPVLPGETLKSALMQARAVTQPVKNSLLGWWLEYYFFYVKHRDIVTTGVAQGLQDMMLDYSYNPAALQTGSATVHYAGANTFRYTQWCLETVCKWFFRADGEAWNNALLTWNTGGQLPAAAVNVRNWMDSIYTDTEFKSSQADSSLVVGVDDTVTGSEISQLLATYELLRANGYTEMTYEDWLTTYGVRPSRESLNKPELVRYLRFWQYPSNTIDPNDGSASAAVSWAVSERIDKDRYFREPGMLFGVSVLRPKVYFGGQKATVTGYMQNMLDWLPAMLHNPRSSMRPNADDALINTTDTNGIWFDIRDLFLYGEQFTNFGVSQTDMGFVALPTAALQKRYPSQADVDALWTTATNNYLLQDGLVSLNIATSQKDSSGTT